MALFDALNGNSPRSQQLQAGLLGLASGLLQGSSGNYGQFGPALGQGFAGFGQGMGQAQLMQQRQQAFELQKRKADHDLALQQQAQQWWAQNGGNMTSDTLRSAIATGNPHLMQTAQLANTIRSTDMRGDQMELDEWSAPVQTSRGFGQVNRRTGAFRPVLGDDGQVLMPTTIDPTAQGAVATAKAYGTETGKGQAEREMSLSTDLAQIDNMERSIDNILSHPGLPWAVGTGAILPKIPGTPQADFIAASNQLEGQAFLQAFESLKGGGQITEIEGQKATQAIGRLDRAQSQEEYKRSLQELKDVLAAARQRIQRHAGGAPSPATQPGDFSNLWGG